MSDIRQMVEGDLTAVNLLLSKTFTHARYQAGYRKGRVPLCRKEFLQLYFNANPSGSFVIEKDHRIVAFCFSRLWGKTAWFGPLGVEPSAQGKGDGTRIVLHAVENLKKSGARTIGLETSANSSKNLAFYSKLGFKFDSLTVDLIRRIAPKAQPTERSGYERL
ncbi:MAG: GNAT family N-acetyltransferase, partial [bacterium]